MTAVYFGSLDIGDYFYSGDVTFVRIELFYQYGQPCNAQIYGKDTYTYFAADDIVYID